MPIALFGPIEINSSIANAFVWANALKAVGYYEWAHQVKWANVPGGPTLDVPAMNQNRPIGIYFCRCRWLWLGQYAFGRDATDAPGWAH